MSKQVTSLMDSLLDMYNYRKEKSLTDVEFDLHKNACNITKRINALTAVRDQYAIYNLDSTLHARQMRNDLILCYEYNGQKYYIGRHAINGYRSSDELHERNLPQSEWDKMGKMWVWKHSGVIESIVK